MALHRPPKSSEKGKNSSLTCCCLENHQSDKVYPQASGAGPHDVLDKSPISGFVVTCVKTDLKHGRLHVVASVKFLLRYGFKPFPQQGILDLNLREVPVFGLAACCYPPFVFGPCHWDYLSRSLVHDSKFIIIQRKIVS